MEKNASPISLDSRAIIRGRSVHGSLFGGLKPKLDIPILVDRYLKKVFDYSNFELSKLYADKGWYINISYMIIYK